MRSDRDEMVRFRAECKRLQIENGELKRTRTIIHGIPEKDHNQALDKIKSLESRVATLQAAIHAEKSRKPEPVKIDSETAKRSEQDREIKEIRAASDKLRAQLKSVRTSLVRLAAQKDKEARSLQGEINQLKGIIRAYK